MADRRDGTTWVALELTRQGEKEVETGTLDGELRSALTLDAGWPIFIPSRVYKRGAKKVVVHLMEGYAFVASGLDEVNYFRLEHEGKLVERVMTASSPGGLRVLKTIPDRQIRELRRKLVEEVSSDLEPNIAVHVSDGRYKGLEGVVLMIEGEYALVSIELRSMEIVATIPRVFLTADGDEAIVIVN